MNTSTPAQKALKEQIIKEMKQPGQNNDIWEARRAGAMHAISIIEELNIIDDTELKKALRKRYGKHLQI